MTNTLSGSLTRRFARRIQRGSGAPDPPLKNLGTDPLEKHLDPLGPIASRGRSVRPSVKYMYIDNCQDSPGPHELHMSTK